ncbi:MAG: GIY-YIG nuclease family protein [Actinobacteria bacterium]|jgi:hypothetical protein|nr:GIY-YIG nuclease family protein [Actinomycetota bacterium]
MAAQFGPGAKLAWESEVVPGQRRSHGVKITIFLIDGTPEGKRLSTKSGWTGACLDFSRSDYSDVRARPELARTGVYVLVGPDESRPERERVYVGEADAVRTRLDAHQKEKDFWTRAFVFISREDEGLDKAHVRYLEAQLVARAAAARSALLENSTAPEPRGLGEAERAEMDAFLDEVLLLLPLLGVSHFTGATARHLSVVAGSSNPGHALPPVPSPARALGSAAAPPQASVLSRPVAPAPGERLADARASTRPVYQLVERGRGAGGRVTVSGQASRHCRGLHRSRRLVRAGDRRRYEPRLRRDEGCPACGRNPD